jgi:transcriptional regulator with XRE-family HTH domain
MPVKKIDLGPTGVTVARNIRVWREIRRLSHTDLSRLLTDQGHNLAPLGLRRIEERARRVDVSDLIAIAIALNISPLTLLLPTEDAFLVEKGGQLEVDRIWAWGRGQALNGEHPLLGGDPIAFVRDSNPLAPASITIAGVTVEAVGTVHYRRGADTDTPLYEETWQRITRDADAEGGQR